MQPFGYRRSTWLAWTCLFFLSQSSLSEAFLQLRHRVHKYNCMDWYTATGLSILVTQQSSLNVQLSDVPVPTPTGRIREKPLSVTAKFESILKVIQLICASMVVAVSLIAWEELSTTHPMRSYVSSDTYFGSTVRGMAFGVQERQRVPMDVEPESLQSIPSYNEVLQKHRTSRVAKWKVPVTLDKVEDSVQVLQRVLLAIDECKSLAQAYAWDDLSKAIRAPILTNEFDEACDILNQATEFLTLEARMEIGFDFGSCSWRHCGAFADVREAIDELEHLIGVLGKL